MEGFLLPAFVFLAAACIIVPISRKTGLGSVIGYLAAGILIGPYVLGLVSEPEDVLHFAEFGVVMMLFLIGLELQPKELWHMRAKLLGTGGSQVLITAIAIGGVAFAAGLAWGQAALIGLALALSSTAIVLQIMNERGMMDTPVGKSAFSVLLLQDIAIIPIIASIPLLAAYAGVEAGGHYGDDGHGAGGSLHLTGWQYVLAVFGVFAGMIIAGRVLLRRMFRVIAQSGVRELFTAISLLLVIGAALLMEMLGLSAALGAFTAGVVLADSEYRHQLERDIEPFKALLLGLFFMSVGMSINFDILLGNPQLIIGLTLALMIGKFIILFVIAKAAKLGKGEGLLFSALLAQGGEFALVIFQYGLIAGAIDGAVAEQLKAVVALSMALTPLFILLIDRLVLTRLNNTAEKADVEDMPEGLSAKVLIIGFGRVGQIVGRVLSTQDVQTTIIDHDPDHIEFIRQFGYKVYFGNAEDVDLLRLAGAQSADLIVLAIDDRDRATNAQRLIRKHFPNTKLIVRVRNRQHMFDAGQIGADHIDRETFHSALSMGQAALRLIGLTEELAEKLAIQFREHDFATAREQIEARDDEEKRIQIGVAARQNIEETMRADRQRRENPAPE